MAANARNVEFYNIFPWNLLDRDGKRIGEEIMVYFYTYYPHIIDQIKTTYGLDAMNPTDYKIQVWFRRSAAANEYFFNLQIFFPKQPMGSNLRRLAHVTFHIPVFDSEQGPYHFKNDYNAPNVHWQRDLYFRDASNTIQVATINSGGPGTLTPWGSTFAAITRLYILHYLNNVPEWRAAVLANIAALPPPPAIGGRKRKSRRNKMKRNKTRRH